MRRAFLLIAILGAGLSAGCGAAVLVDVWREVEGAPAPEPAPEQVAEEREFVATGPILTPLVSSDGSLVGYASIEVQLEVRVGQAEVVKQRLPLLLHAINLQTFRFPLAAGPDGTLPDLSRFRALVTGAASKTFGPGAVHQVAITQARPA